MSLFGISVSGMLANQSSLNTISHNIANANVEGYSRQRADQTPRNPEYIGGSYIGTGVEIGNVKRIYEAIQQLEVQQATATFYNYETYSEQASRVDGLLADSDNGIDNALQSFFTALQGVVNDPASIPARQVFLSESGIMLSRFDLVHSQLESQVTQINGSISSTADEISAIADAIANLNKQIAGLPGNPPPDLLDRRDVEINRLSELVAVQTLAQADGSLNVFIGTGQSLVVGGQANSLVASIDPLNPRGMRLELSSASSTVDITQNLTSGKLGGFLDVIDEVIEPAFNTLGRVAIAVADTFNQQHRLGMDLNDQLGGDYFTDINDSAVELSRVVPSPANVGNSVVSITVDDPSLLNDSNYQIYMSGGNFQLVDISKGLNLTSFAPPVAPGSVTIASEGITINFLSGASVNGDTFEIQPTRNFSRDVQLLISLPEEIAAASPIRGEQLSSNIGNGDIARLTVSDTTTAQFTTTPGALTPPIRIVFDAIPGDFSIYDMTTGLPVLMAGGLSGYVANQENDMLALAGPPFNAYGYEVTLQGDPQPGDSFDISYNNNGIGNNDNIGILGDLQFASTLDNGNSSYQQAFGRVISSVGVRTQAADIKRDAAESLLFQAKERKESTSGVNLDEEAANIIKYQQAYEASAQVVAVARTLFQTFLDAVR